MTLSQLTLDIVAFKRNECGIIPFLSIFEESIVELPPLHIKQPGLDEPLVERCANARVLLKCRLAIKKSCACGIESGIIDSVHGEVQRSGIKLAPGRCKTLLGFCPPVTNNVYPLELWTHRAIPSLRISSLTGRIEKMPDSQEARSTTSVLKFVSYLRFTSNTVSVI